MKIKDWHKTFGNIDPAILKAQMDALYSEMLIKAENERKLFSVLEQSKRIIALYKMYPHLTSKLLAIEIETLDSLIKKYKK